MPKSLFEKVWDAHNVRTREIAAQSHAIEIAIQAGDLAALLALKQRLMGLADRLSGPAPQPDSAR